MGLEYLKLLQQIVNNAIEISKIKLSAFLLLLDTFLKKTKNLTHFNCPFVCYLENIFGSCVQTHRCEIYLPGSVS